MKWETPQSVSHSFRNVKYRALISTRYSWLWSGLQEQGEGVRSRDRDSVSPSSHSVMMVHEASNKPLIVGEHELFLLRGWQALDLRCPCCYILTLERGSEVKPLNAVKWTISAWFNFPGGLDRVKTGHVDWIVICLVLWFPYDCKLFICLKFICKLLTWSMIQNNL